LGTEALMDSLVAVDDNIVSLSDALRRRTSDIGILAAVLAYVAHERRPTFRHSAPSRHARLANLDALIREELRLSCGLDNEAIDALRRDADGRRA
jgi:hypothetical protein